MLAKTIPFYFRQPTLDSVTVPELQRAISKYPYSSALQLLLLKKLQIENDPGYGTQWEKCSLFYPNPFLLQAVLDAPDGPSWKETERASGFPKKQLRAVEEVLVKDQPILIEEDIEEQIEEQIEEAAQPAPEILQQPEPIRVEETITEEEIPVAEDPVTAEAAAVEKSSATEQQPAESMLRMELLLKESPIPIPGIKDISPQTDDQPLFEPYHTIDYFASQGIKLGNDLPANDKLGKQLKSFTDWIRTMKKLPQPTLERQLMETSNGEKIVAMAAGSVLHREVLTETMAEVLVKQGNRSKAIELYHKLSLAHPDKSVYFAARIEQLKQD